MDSPAQGALMLDDCAAGRLVCVAALLFLCLGQVGIDSIGSIKRLPETQNRSPEVQKYFISLSA